jgi:asparagine synthase (glutamine-hydrolysing)
VRFIHGAVSAAVPLGVLQRHVESMLSALDDYPWRGCELLALGGGRRPSCVLAVQDSLGQPEGAISRHERAAGPHASIVADLQLHDRAGLANQLGLQAVSEAVLSDAGLVLRAYERWGATCADRIVGVGAFAIWDPDQGRLLCWRDAVGARPLYYHHAPGRVFAFSSDLKSLAAHPHVPGTLELGYARALFEYGEAYQHPSLTLREGVRKLPAAHVLTHARSALHVRRYWRPGGAAPRRHRQDREYVEELRTLLASAVACRLPDAAEGVVGAHLSGGLDSTSVAVLGRRELCGRKLVGISWAPPWDDFPSLEDEERPLVDLAARAADIPLRYTRQTTEDIVATHSRDLALEPTTTLDAEVAAGRNYSDSAIRTVLSGWGGDESVAFNGRGYFADLARRGRWLTIQREFRMRNEIQEWNIGSAWRGRVIQPLLADRLYHRRWPVPRYALPDTLRPDFANQLAQAEPSPRRGLRERPGVHRMQALLLTCGHLQYRMESWASYGATLGVTYAFPLLDQRIIEFALSIPDDLYFRQGWKRWLYRTAMAGIVPDEVRWHPRKQDTAFAEHRKLIYEAAREPYLARVEGRRDNPFVNTARVAEYARARRTPGALVGHSDGRLPPSKPLDAAWLAFVKLSPP